MTSECPKCKSPVARDGQKFCYRCGAELPDATESDEAKPGSEPEALVKNSESNPPQTRIGGSPPAEMADKNVPQPRTDATEVLEQPVVEAILAAASKNDTAAPQAILRVLLPTGDVFDRDLGESDTQLGKGPRNDIVIADPAVSSAHALIRVADGAFALSDLGSRNGTFINGERVTEPRTLQHGDVIGMGLSKLTFRLSGVGETGGVPDTTLAPGITAKPLPLTEDSLAKAVVAGGLVSQEAVDRFRGSDAQGRRLCAALVQERLVSELALRDLMSTTFRIPVIDLESEDVDEAVVLRLPAQVARDRDIFAVRTEGEKIVLAVADPTNKSAIDQAERELRSKVSLRVATDSQIAACIDRHYAPKLIGVLPSGEKLEYPITQHETEIGKAAHNSIVLSDLTVSNTHAIVIVRGDGYSIVDLGSRNGTFVNGERLGAQAHTLRHGDSIQLGQTVLTFRNPGETAANVTAVLSAEALQEVRSRAAAASGERPGIDPLAATAESSAIDAEKKKKKKKKKEKGERMRAAYIGGLSRILAQVIAVVMSVGLALYITRSTSQPDRPAIQSNGKGKSALKLAAAGTWNPLSGGTYEASGVAFVPGSGGVLFVDDSEQRGPLWMQIDESGRQVGQPKPIDLGFSIEDPEGITFDGSYFYVVGSQSKPNSEGNLLVRFVFDAANQTVAKAEGMTNLRGFLVDNVPELQGQGDKKGSDGGLSVEGIAWDFKRGRWLLGLRSPQGTGSQALIVAIKLRNPAGSFTTDNLQLAEPRAIALSLGGLGIRDIQYDPESNLFLIISGAPEHLAKTDFVLWEWTGDVDQSNPDSTPREIAKLDSNVKPEGITHVDTGSRKFIFLVGDASSYARLDYSDAP